MTFGNIIDAIFRPKSVAVIGASETDGSVGKKPKTNEKVISLPYSIS
jgi:acyl-CoA synthetase (NDP forming)